LDKLLKHAETLPVQAAVPVTTKDESVSPSGADPGIASMTLVAFLQKHGATTNQTKKFLATALWTMAKQGKGTFTTKDVTAALTKAQQQKLGNASQCLANVLKSGAVEKGNAGECYVTPEGKKTLGIAE
jgi:hypothetical protein